MGYIYIQYIEIPGIIMFQFFMKFRGFFCFSLIGFRTLFMCMYIFYHSFPYLNLAVNISLCIELYYYLCILNTVLSLISMCKLLFFKHIPEDDKQYLYRKFGKIFSLLFSPRNFIKNCNVNNYSNLYIIFIK